jgi:hypothetical protein
LIQTKRRSKPALFCCRRKSQNRNKINLSDDGEVRYWTESLRVSREPLEELVRRHGDSANEIREKLKKEPA